MKRILLLATAIAIALGHRLPAATDAPLDLIKLPSGFRIDLYASDLPAARQMALSPNGTLFVGSMRLGVREKRNVYAVVDRNKDQKGDGVIVVATELDTPNGVAFHDGSLYVAEMNRIVRFGNIEAHLNVPPPPVVVIDKLPGMPQHGWKTIAFGPDGKLYVTVGAPCNVCDTRAEAPRSGTILRMNPDGTGVEIYARGVRNSVGIDWHPVTRELWFTNNGRDMLGDDVPPDTLNRAPRSGMDFGFPYCHAGDIPDPEFGRGRACQEFAAPARKLGAHVASLGLAFYTGSMFPPEYRNQIFIAEHGSWNRMQKVGYRVSLVRVAGGTNPPAYEPFAEGWLQGQRNWGRPVDVLVMPDGALLVSDEQVGAIYRISYGAARR